MNNKYRNNFVNKIELAVEEGQHVPSEDIQRAVGYIEDAIRILDNKAESILKKERKRLEKENKEIDKQLGEEEVELVSAEQ